MTLESIEKMRKALKDCTNVSGIEPNKFDTYWITAAACDKYIDEIEREIAESYMRLPVDADGVPIHVGDVMEFSYGPDEVEAVHPERIFTLHEGEWLCVEAKNKRHVKQRTVEDVLRDMALDVLNANNQLMSVQGTEAYIEAAVGEYADELKNMGVGE